MHAYISGRPEFKSNFPISLKGGLPKIIPGSLRLLMRGKDLSVIRGVLSVLAVYRVISIPGKTTVETIIGSFEGQSSTLPSYEVICNCRELFNRKKDSILKPIRLLNLGTAGPNHSVSMLGIPMDILAWSQSSLFPTLQSYLTGVPGGQDLLDIMNQDIKLLTPHFKGDKKLILGRLSEKKEAAGKIRIFAITDAITQSVFSPLSDCIFSILRRLPMDGTFDQNRPVQHLLNLHSEGLLNGETFYSYDLSAATDRLPIDFQVQVLSQLIGPSLATH